MERISKDSRGHHSFRWLLVLEVFHHLQQGHSAACPQCPFLPEPYTHIVSSQMLERGVNRQGWWSDKEGWWLQDHSNKNLQIDAITYILPPNYRNISKRTHSHLTSFYLILLFWWATHLPNTTWWPSSCSNEPLTSQTLHDDHQATGLVQWWWRTERRIKEGDEELRGGCRVCQELLSLLFLCHDFTCTCNPI